MKKESLLISEYETNSGTWNAISEASPRISIRSTPKPTTHNTATITSAFCVPRVRCTRSNLKFNSFKKYLILCLFFNKETNRFRVRKLDKLSEPNWKMNWSICICFDLLIFIHLFGILMKVNTEKTGRAEWNYGSDHWEINSFYHIKQFL